MESPVPRLKARLNFLVLILLHRHSLPLISETYVVKSLHVTNKSGANTPTITITNNGFQVINTQTLTAATSVEIFKQSYGRGRQYGSFLYDGWNG